MTLAQHAAELNEYAERLLQWCSPEVTQRVMVQVGQEARAIIYKRTVLDGLDVDGAPFPPYSTRRVEIMPGNEYFSLVAGGGRTYRLRGRERGAALAGAIGAKRKRSSKGEKKLKGVVYDAGWAQIKQALGATHRNMMMRGDMMGQFSNPTFVVVASTNETVTIDFQNAKERQKAVWTHERWNWWGIGRISKEREQLAASITEHWMAELRKLQGKAL